MASKSVSYNSSSTTVNMTTSTQYYVLDALSGTSYTYTLSLITCNGIKFKIARVDNTTGTCSIVTTSPNTIYPGSVTSVTLGPQSSIELVSYNGQYIIITSGRTTAAGSALFCAPYLDNNTNPGIPYNGNVDFIIFPYMGTLSGRTINTIIVMHRSGGVPNLNFYNKNSGTTIFNRSNDYNVFTPSNTYMSVYILTNPEKALLPTGSACMACQFSFFVSSAYFINVY